MNVRKIEDFDTREALKKVGDAFDEFRTTHIEPLMRKAKSHMEDYTYGTKVTICDTGAEYSIAVEVPGVDKETLKVEATNFGLNIEGKSDDSWEKITESTNILLNERDTSEIQRKLTFPEEIKSAETTATLKNGVLYVTLPKKNPRVVGEAIPVKIAGGRLTTSIPPLFIFNDSSSQPRMDKVKILGFGGSLRKGSYSSALLHAAEEEAPEGVEVELWERIAEVPPFNEDAENSPPPVIVDFKARIRRADAILVATPEYNYSIPGYLKNAIDWASRPYGDNAFAGKPVAMLSSSTGSIGGARAQYHMRQCFVFLEMHPINMPECIISHAQDKIGEDGKLSDLKIRQKIDGILATLADWTRRLKRGEVPA